MPRTARSHRTLLAITAGCLLVLAACGASERPTLDADAATPTVIDDDGPRDDATTGDATDGDVAGDAADGDAADDDNNNGGSPSRDDGASDEPTDAGDEAADTAGGGDESGGDDAAADPGTDVVAEVLFSLFVTGGFVPVDVALSEFPSLVVFSDGSVYRPAGDIAAFPRPLTPALERVQLDATAVASVEAAIRDSGVVDPSIDFGQPNVTDVPFTMVAARVDGAPVEISAFALGFDEGVDAAAAANRDTLTLLIDTVRATVDAAADTAVPTEPPALAILSFPGLQYQENDTARDWPVAAVPVPAPPGADCVVVTGADVSTLWTAAAGATTQTPWNIDGETKALAFRPVFPHEDFC